MIFSPIVAILHDVVHNRWHPIYFRECPTPSDNGESLAVRYKSGGHHTAGFDTREDAITSAHAITEALKPQALGDVRECLDTDIPWDGDPDTAVMVCHWTRTGDARLLF